MNIAFSKRLMVVWLILSALTLAYLWIDHSAEHRGLPTASTVVTVSAVVIAVVKVRIIFREFMDVRHAPPWLCRLTDTWVVLIAVCLLASYLAGSVISVR